MTLSNPNYPPKLFFFLSQYIYISLEELVQALVDPWKSEMCRVGQQAEDPGRYLGLKSD